MNLANMLARQAAISPDTISVIDSQRSLNLRQLDAAVWALTLHLSKQGVRAGDICGLQVGDPLLHVVSTFALARLGAVQFAVSSDSIDAERNATLLHRVKAGAVLCDSVQPGSAFPSPILLDAEMPFSADSRAEPAIVHAGGDWPLIYKSSSGTTGAQKIVGATHYGMIASIERELAVIGYPRGERYLTPVALQFDAPKRRTLACIVAGGTVVLCPPSPSIGPLFELMDRHDVRHFSCVPRQAADLVGSLPPGRQRFPNMRLFRLSAAPADKQILERIRERFCANVVLSYGCSELGPMTFADPAQVRNAPHAVGRPMPGVKIEIVSASDQPLPIAATGIVRVQAQGMPAGYIDDAAATARQFRDGWFYPGDLGFIDPDGMLALMGRSDDMMIFDGMNIAPREIESVLQEHPAVLEAAAFPLRSRESYQLPAAAVVARADTDVTALMRFAQERLGGRSPVMIFSVNMLPRNAGGKVLKSELAKLAESHLAGKK